MERAGTRPAALRNRPPARPCCCIPAFLEAPVLHNADHRPSHSRVLALGFSAHAALSDTESDLLRDLAGKTRYHPPYRDLHAAEAAPPPPRMIVAGWAAQYRQLASGQRQIVSLRLPQGHSVLT